jgi:hypothetical protein|tara:strand:- start:150 stop:374 length:225 start_codon:yes stop_codon:yes gene_type:complete
MVGDILILRGTWKSYNIDRKIGLVLEEKTKTIPMEWNYQYQVFLIYVYGLPVMWVSELAINKIISLENKNDIKW